jgi:uncharacterized circularly permuted ATP-grasp superfamily protein/uncharacterized alpha-E superfamily protein
MAGDDGAGMNPANYPRIDPACQSLFASYRGLSGAYDEMIAPDGAMRQTWLDFAELLDALGSQELNRRWQQARRLLHEDGVTYNVHDEAGRDSRWELDAVPLLVSAEEWRVLARGLEQRARLLDAILVDLYGPGRLLSEGLLPAELIFSDPNFLRPCHGWSPAGGRYLHLCATHLARSPDGSWWAVADRTQAPIGPGYAVENRIVISRMIPHVFHHCRVERLAGFFITLRETLRSIAPRQVESPHAVLFSPGPSSPTYFEDAYLARYLGYTLVEAEDLTVRDNRVFLKTLGGLIDVDLVLRRVRDRDCDPLELESDSRFGVAGLVHAARRGNVVLANALGSGLLEMPALLAFLPALCRRLLDEDLLLPSVRTWWCGDPQSLSYVLAHFERLVVRPALADGGARPIPCASLSAEQRGQLAEKIKASPSRFVAQELIARSSAPVWGGADLGSKHIALRAFTVARDDAYQAMPGALAHVSTTSAAPGESMFVGHGSKDVWVQAEGPVASVSLLPPPGAPMEPRRSGNDLPSRVADNLFWLGRQVERAEGAARLLRALLSRLVSESGPGAMHELGVLYRAATWLWPRETWSAAIEEPVSEPRVLLLIYDRQHPGSLRSLLSELRRVALTVRDRISLDSWRIVSRIEDDFHPGYPLGVVSTAEVLAMLNQMILSLSAFSGVVMENMTRGPGWQFLELGRRIERALTTIALLRSTLFVPALSEHAVLEALLEIADSSMTYRNRYATNLQLVPLIDLLVTDETNPRSIAFQLSAVSEHVDRLPRQQPDALPTHEQRLAISLLSNIRLVELNRLVDVGESGTRWELENLLEKSARQLCELADVISHKYLVHAGPTYQMSVIHRG